MRAWELERAAEESPRGPILALSPRALAEGCRSRTEEIATQTPTFTLPLWRYPGALYTEYSADRLHAELLLFREAMSTAIGPVPLTAAHACEYLSLTLSYMLASSRPSLASGAPLRLHVRDDGPLAARSAELDRYASIIRDTANHPSLAGIPRGREFSSCALSIAWVRVVDRRRDAFESLDARVQSDPSDPYWPWVLLLAADHALGMEAARRRDAYAEVARTPTVPSWARAYALYRYTWVRTRGAPWSPLARALALLAGEPPDGFRQRLATAIREDACRMAGGAP